MHLNAGSTSPRSWRVVIQARIVYLKRVGDDAVTAHLRYIARDEIARDTCLRHLAVAMANQYSFKTESLTSWIGNTITTFLSEDQVARLAVDARVKSISADRRVRFSASVWQNGTRTSWGTTAVGTANALANSIRVYVLDSGVGYHYDLPYVSRAGATPTTNPVGCYAHSTHVAGIIGAIGTTLPASIGSQGVVVGIPIISVGVGADNSNLLSCANGPATPAAVLSAYLAGLEWIRNDIVASNRLGVVNISSNLAEFKASGVLGTKLTQLKTPVAGYRGAFIVESAGNGLPPDASHPVGSTQNACNVSYDASNASDGIMVVGAIDANGQQVVPLAGMYGMKNTVATSQAGSNFGSCVDVWAPGKDIWSTWKTVQQNPPTLNDEHAMVSGTSMAAPHIAALAAYVGTLWGSTTPSQLEHWSGAMRTHWDRQPKMAQPSTRQTSRD